MFYIVQELPAAIAIGAYATRETAQRNQPSSQVYEDTLIGADFGFPEEESLVVGYIRQAEGDRPRYNATPNIDPYTRYARTENGNWMCVGGAKGIGMSKVINSRYAEEIIVQSNFKRDCPEPRLIAELCARQIGSIVEAKPQPWPSAIYDD